MNDSIIDYFPAAPPPEGVTPNFVNPSSIAKLGTALICVSLSFMLVVVAVRVYARLRVSRPLGADDCLCFAAAAFATSYCGIGVWLLLAGHMGLHSWDVPITGLMHDLKKNFLVYELAAICLYIMSAMFIKVSILVSYLRFFRQWRSGLVLIWTGVPVIVLFYLTSMTLTVVLCHPKEWATLEELSGLLQAGGKCYEPIGNLDAIVAVFSMASDIYIVGIPMLFVPRLQLSIERKVAVCVLFLAALLATGCAIASTYYHFEQAKVVDYTYRPALRDILGALELNIGIICSSMPATLVVYKRAIKSTIWIQFIPCIFPKHIHKRNPPTEAIRSRRTPERQHQFILPSLRFGSDTSDSIMTGLKAFIRGDRSTAGESKDFSDA